VKVACQKWANKWTVNITQYFALQYIETSVQAISTEIMEAMEP
jgi:hypothetical protein